MGLTDAVRTCLRRWSDFQGRARRPEFWWWVLANAGVNLLLNLLPGWASLLVSLVTLVPTLAVATRRLHDVGRSGWWQLAIYLPLPFMFLGAFIGAVAGLAFLVLLGLLLFWLARPGETAANAYGPPALP